ncbi:Bcr/CflA subfamily drug resistance transporter (plasmid) [Zymomonas mobilis subsp. mobilis ZM4 = ATCC 31821]|nr:Bcr/CflA subfamily drug resistance transporter [Zymomonas mobilis subsp. mobilis]AVZ28724.1 Bcr/CflA subfamily drug resistance transporter [Zymomonas mobilis subsp. mobilis]AVZ43170.1 Bcr/CflA subfamily drug resistance transporter [Zymomonas mobilis subsp. mobilis ZM4 = ATCC 31821]
MAVKASTTVPECSSSRESRWWTLGVLSLLMGFASISTDVYLPAMPAMSQALLASPGAVEWTVSGYLVGFSLGQLFWGPVSDRYGRRVPVATGIVIFIIGSALCACAASIGSLIVWRIVQAFGASAGVVLSRAMVRDLYEGHHAVRMLSTLITVMAIAPLLGPIVGAQILTIGGWRAVFALLAVVGISTFATIFTLPETLPSTRRHHEPLSRAFLRYGELLTTPRLLAYTGAGAFFYGGMFAYVAGTPFAYISFYHVSPRYYGLLFGAGILGIMATNMINARLAHRIGSDCMLRFGTFQAAAAGILVALVAWSGYGGLWGLVALLFVFVSATGFIVANSIAGALNVSPERSGSVSAFVGAAQYGGGILGSGLIGVFADGTPWPMGAAVALAGLGSCLCALVLLFQHFGSNCKES